METAFDGRETVYFDYYRPRKRQGNVFVLYTNYSCAAMCLEVLYLEILSPVERLKVNGVKSVGGIRFNTVLSVHYICLVE